MQRTVWVLSAVGEAPWDVHRTDRAHPVLASSYHACPNPSPPPAPALALSFPPHLPLIKTQALLNQALHLHTTSLHHTASSLPQVGSSVSGISLKWDPAQVGFIASGIQPKWDPAQGDAVDSTCAV